MTEFQINWTIEQKFEVVIEAENEDEAYEIWEKNRKDYLTPKINELVVPIDIYSVED